MIPKHILFICTGNSCRSVMAQRFLQKIIQESGIKDVTVKSAGVFAVEGMAATRETQNVLQQVGVDCSDHLARIVTEGMVDKADLILVMEEFHKEEILRRFPGAEEMVHLLKEYGNVAQDVSGNFNIPDPIGKPLEVYEVCFTDIREAVERIGKTFGVYGA